MIEAWGLGFCLGNTVKYVCRAGRRLPQAPQPEGMAAAARRLRIEDLKKARWYLDREISRLETPDV